MGMRVQQQPDQFDLARKRAMQDANTAKQTQSDALQRRYAAAGMANSGSAIKSQRLASEAVDKQLADTNAGIDSAQQQEAARQKEIQDSRDFAASESAASRALQEKMFNQDFAFKQQARGDANSQFEKQYDLSQKQFTQDREITALNAIIAAKEAGVPWTGFAADKTPESNPFSGLSASGVQQFVDAANAKRAEDERNAAMRREFSQKLNVSLGGITKPI